jgi:lauroyl/myristoyl acyltransferase
MDLPPTIPGPELLRLLGRVLENDPRPQSTGELRLRFFQPGFSWQALVDFAIGHKVLPPLIVALKERSLLLPVPSTLGEKAAASHVTSRLVAAYREHEARQTDLREQLRTVTRALNQNGIVPILLKGAAELIDTNTPWRQAREMRDLDLLVHKFEADAAYQLLVSLGYWPEKALPHHPHHLPELRLPRHAGAIEIHTEILEFSARHALSTEDVIDRAELQAFDDAKLKVLPLEWRLLHHLLHYQLVDRGHARRRLALKGLWEFSKLGGELSEPQWQNIIQHAVQRKFLEMLSSWTVQAKLLFGLNAPGQLMAFKAGINHAETTFSWARRSYFLRKTAFITDTLTYSFSPKTLAQRYPENENTGRAALRHVNFLLRHRLPRIPRIISFQDIHEVFRLAWMGTLAWMLPQCFWWPISRLLGGLNVVTHPARTRFDTDLIAKFRSATASQDAHDINVANWANRYEEKFQYLRAWRLGGWNPQIDISGAGHVYEAVARGRGLVIWGSNFSFNSLLAMMAVHRLGLSLARFSVPQHGFSNTRFGILHLNKVCTDIENRYLGERVVAEPHEMSAALQYLRKLLKANGVVYFSVGARGRRTAKIKFLGNCIILATAPLAIAHETGATMLPLYALRVEPGRFEVTFGAPLNFPCSSTGDVDYTETIQAYADALAPFVLRDPGQWLGWHLARSWTPW